MIVDNRGDTLDLIVVFERPTTPELQAKLDYIMDTISELEADYDFEFQNLS